MENLKNRDSQKKPSSTGLSRFSTGSKAGHDRFAPDTPVRPTKMKRKGNQKTSPL